MDNQNAEDAHLGVLHRTKGHSEHMREENLKKSIAAEQLAACTCGVEKGACPVHERRDGAAMLADHTDEQILEQALKPDAMGPEALREDLIVIVKTKGLPMTYHAAEIKVDACLERLMQFYAAQATPEVNSDSAKVMALLGGIEGCMNACLNAGAGVVHMMSIDQQNVWRKNAARLRQEVAGLLSILT